jgi:hypothetical protein
MNAMVDVRPAAAPDAPQRLRVRRRALGYHSAKAFALAHGINVTTYQHHEAGRRTLTLSQMKRYADLLGIHTTTLLNDAPYVPNNALVAGRVDAKDGSIRLEPDGQAIAVPDFAAMTALRIEGDGLYPAYRDGDVVFYRNPTPVHGREKEVHGRDCVVDMANGKRLLRQVVVQAGGRLVLMAPNSAPILDAPVITAAPVEFVRRA